MAVDNHSAQSHTYLADDDSDDRDLFADAMLEIEPDVILKQAHDGMYLMDDLLVISDT